MAGSYDDNVRPGFWTNGRNCRAKTRTTGLRKPAGTPRSLSAFPEGPDPHGQVALMLCESLFHLLVEKGVLSHQTALEAIEGVAELIEETADHDFQAVNARAAAVLIDTIHQSFLQKDRAGAANP
jgi:hypothetical protein